MIRRLAVVACLVVCVGSLAACKQDAPRTIGNVATARFRLFGGSVRADRRHPTMAQRTRTADGKWMAISSASPTIAVRVFRAIGRPDLADDPDYIDPVRRQERFAEVDALVGDWVALRPLAEVMEVFLAAEIAAAPIYDAEQLLADEHLAARGTFVPVDDPDFGTVRVQAPLARLSATPGRIDHLGRALGADNDTVYRDLLGLDAERLDALRAAGVI
jgi:crotonobetainyl-CoA:carnitine CoA-transferase CaiB-like acyl-CoA transferase